MKNNMKYTAGELAKKLGVSSRTIRFYDEKRLLKPCDYSESGYRLYDERSAQQLQKILMLKYMDFSLEQIAEMINDEDTDIRQSLRVQERLLNEKREHIVRLIDAVNRTVNSSDDEIWDNMRHIIDMTKDREEVIEQYKTDDNLNNRINIHDYSTSKVNWYDWLVDKVEITEGMKVLDIGCGNAMLWKGVAHRLPNNLEIHLVDYSDGMLASAKENVTFIQEKYPEKNLTFVIEKRDATDFSYPTSGFDRIMANHMLYHMKKESRPQLYNKIKSLLGTGGRFTCSLIGETHMKELHEFLLEYYPDIDFPSANFDILLENAKEELNDFFNVLKIEEHENNLLVPDEELVFNYVASYSQKAKEFINRDRELFYERVRSKMNDEGIMYIHKSTGIVICEI